MWNCESGKETEGGELESNYDGSVLWWAFYLGSAGGEYETAAQALKKDGRCGQTWAFPALDFPCFWE